MHSGGWGRESSRVQGQPELHHETLPQVTKTAKREPKQVVRNHGDRGRGFPLLVPEVPSVTLLCDSACSSSNGSCEQFSWIPSCSVFYQAAKRRGSCACQTSTLPLSSDSPPSTYGLLAAYRVLGSGIGGKSLSHEFCILIEDNETHMLAGAPANSHRVTRTLVPGSLR